MSSEVSAAKTKTKQTPWIFVLKRLEGLGKLKKIQRPQ
jgi:hypothetical protein